MHAQYFKSKMFDRQLKCYCLSVSGPTTADQSRLCSTMKIYNLLQVWC